MKTRKPTEQDIRKPTPRHKYQRGFATESPLALVFSGRQDASLYGNGVLSHLARMALGLTALVWVAFPEALPAQSRPNILWMQPGVTGPVSGIAVSPDGAMLATSEETDTQIWQLPSGRLLRTFPAFSTNPSGKAIFSRDGQSIAFTDLSGTLQIRSTSNWALLHTIPIVNGSPCGFSPDGTVIATVGQGYTYYHISDGTALGSSGFSGLISPDLSYMADNNNAYDVSIYYVFDGNQIVNPPQFVTNIPVSALCGTPGWFLTVEAFSPVEESVLIDNGNCQSSMSLSGQVVTGYPAPSAGGAGYSPDGQYVFFYGGAGNGNPNVIDIDQTANAAFVTQIVESNTNAYGDLMSVAISPDDQYVYAGFYPQYGGALNQYRWDGSFVRNFVVNTSEISAVAYSTNGQIIATAVGFDRTPTIRLSRASDGTVLNSFSSAYGAGNSLVANSVSISPDGTLVASDCSGPAPVWRSSDGSLVQAFTNIDASCVAFSPDGQTLAVLTYGTGLKLFRVSDWTQLYNVNPEYFGGAYDTSMSASPAGDLIAVGSGAYVGNFEGIVTILQASTGAVVRTLAGHGGNVAIFSPDGQLVAVGNGANIDLRRVSDFSIVNTLTNMSPAGDGVGSIAFAPDGQTIGQACPDGGLLQLWRVSDGKLLQTFTQETSPVEYNPSFNLAYSPDSRYFTYGRTDGTLVTARNPFRALQFLSGSAGFSNGVFQIPLSGPIGSNFVLQSSADLVTWASIATNAIPESGAFLFSDPGSSNAPQTFYRAQPHP